MFKDFGDMDTLPGTPPKEVEVEVTESKETVTSAVQVEVSTAVEVETHFCKSSSKGSMPWWKGPDKSSFANHGKSDGKGTREP